ncbi:MAG: HAD hydrolase-like protein [Candidatus Magasanikbacteria bacterium]
MNSKVIVCDLDGMINNNIPFSKKYSKKFGIEESIMLDFFYNEFQDCILDRADLKEVLGKYLKIWKWPGTVEELITYWFEDEVNPDKETVEIISTLRGDGLMTCLLTNNERYRMKFMSEKLNFDSMFEKVFSSYEIGFKKPEQEAFSYVYEHVNTVDSLEKNDFLFWDDDLDNVKGAQEFGFQAFQFTNAKEFEEICRK